jgi:transmembrane sensor
MSTFKSWFRREPRNAAQWVARLHSGAMSAADQAALTAWLDRRPEHRSAFDRAGSVWELAQGLRTSAVARGHLAVPAPERRRVRPRPRMMVFGLGASLAAAMLALAIWPRAELYATGPGEVRTVALEDGSTVWLNADSRLRVDFTSQSRRVALDRGEAFFKVTHNAARPFMVEADTRRIIDIGTEFDVRRAPEGIEVSVAEGAVRVATAVQNGAPEALITALSAGEDARFRSGELVPAVAHGTMAQHKGAWREGKIYLDDTQLGAAFDEINRYSPTKLVLSDEKLLRLPISGIFRTGDTDSVLFALHELYRLDARREPGRIVLYSSGE